jgi:hypothetical protein
MKFVHDLLLFLHFVGLASLLGGFLVQMATGPRRVIAAMVHGAFTQLVTGLGLVGVNEALDEPVDNAKVGVKLVVLLVITVLVWVNRAKPAIPNGLFFAVGGLTTLDVAIAVFWT